MPVQRGDPPGVQLSSQEQQRAAALKGERCTSFRRSRLWMRRCLADRLGMAPADVPLMAPPGAPPQLPAGWGWISLSHCPDATVVVWSERPVGVDVERLDRRFAASALASRFFAPDDGQELRSLQGEALRRAVLRQWVAKEAAIKWQRGTLARDLAQWSCRADSRMAHHSRCQTAVPICRMELLETWLVAVAGTDGQIGPACLA